MDTTKTIIRWPFAIFIFLFGGLLLSSCHMDSASVIKGDGNVLSTSHQLDHFRVINISGMYNVMLEAGDEPGLELETDENIQELTEIVVRDNTLYISSKEDAVYRPTKMEMLITYTELEEIIIGGAARLHSDMTVMAENLTVSVSGAADIYLDLEVDALVTIVAGAANIQYKGHAGHHKADLSGASNMRAEALDTRESRISLSGAGSAHVFATEHLHARLSGVGSIRYYGDPAEVIKERSGLGRIRSAGQAN